MFDIGFSELFLIGIVALVVLGPERLPKAARFVGLWVRRARAQWYSVKSELEHELADEELRRSLRATQDELRAAHEDLRAQGDSMRAQFASVGEDARTLDAQLREQVGAAVDGVRSAPVMTGPLAPPAGSNASALDAIGVHSGSREVHDSGSMAHDAVQDDAAGDASDAQAQDTSRPGPPPHAADAGR